jgi:hypothetical protein
MARISHSIIHAISNQKKKKKKQVEAKQMQALSVSHKAHAFQTLKNNQIS